MRLYELCQDFEYQISKEENPEITEIVYDSRKIVPGCLFVCLCGAVSDGHVYAAEAEQKGAAAIVAMKDVDTKGIIPVVRTKDTRRALAMISAAHFGHPAKELLTIGITGTKGKTTTSYFIQRVLLEAGMKTGYVGTVEIDTGAEKIPAVNTTPESYLLQKYMREMVNNGCKAVVMEVSSQGLKMERTSGFVFDIGAFTNLEPDHIGPNEHKDFDEYAECKAKLFRACRFGILNKDDVNYQRMLNKHTCDIMTIGVNSDADLRAEDIDYHHGEGKMMVSYRTKGVFETEVEILVPGLFSVYNSLMAVAVCNHIGIEAGVIRKALRNVQVRGRMENIDISDRFSLLIDYAHNAMSLKSLLTTLKDCGPKRIVCLFGCGGNRSKDRRFEMGEISSTYADLTIVTSDNPRFEKPEDIIQDIITGVKRASGQYVTIPDRKEAIRYAITNSKEGDLIVLAGKGHEDYQEICGVKHPMDERVLIREIIEEMTDEERVACGLRM